MIIRILGEGQFVVADAHLDALNELDDAVEAAARAGDAEELGTALSALLGAVRDSGEPVDVDLLIDSDVILPDAEATLEQILEWMGRDDSYSGIVPQRT
ncbi:MAG: PspA-associated protein PspAA [Propioniciclava sp.]